ncbi:hypothetical protein ACS126_17885 [Sphingobacterium lactis]|uniref:hypothetical protein n=1 Tax=Sphingobacterium lactis TaxID=797291 RepID=UPI003EC707B8
MRRFCTYILLLALTLQSFYRSIMTFDYQIHLPDYIAQCINTARPELHCNGQCVLMKKIREQEKEESQKNFLVYAYSAYYMHTEYVLLKLQAPISDSIHNPFSAYVNAYTFTYDAAVFRPPIA